MKFASIFLMFSAAIAAGRVNAASLQGPQGINPNHSLGPPLEGFCNATFVLNDRGQIVSVPDRRSVMAECQHYCRLKDGMKILPVPTLQDVDVLLNDMKRDLKAFLHQLNSDNNRAVNRYMVNWKKDIHEMLDKPSSDIIGVHDLLVNLQKVTSIFLAPSVLLAVKARIVAASVFPQAPANAVPGLFSAPDNSLTNSLSSSNTTAYYHLAFTPFQQELVQSKEQNFSAS
ncbi:MAG: hypothetical protein J3Q66DRAFT_375305 [Benniella sp.]|nr:MAG: hypothetical protein J3Q66DRAFT_375305 [Benniella sp.]